MSKLTLTQKLEVLTKLREVTSMIPDRPGSVTYDRGWSDQRVANHCEVPRKSVTYIRQAEIGALDRGHPRAQGRAAA